MIKIIDKWRQGIFILLSFLCFAMFFLTSLNLNTQIQSYMLFFLVSLIGIPHGFFDFSIGKNIFQRFRKLWLLYFVSIYILITFFYFSIWIYLPGIALISFLLIASYHFGYEEFNYLGKNKHSFINLSIFIISKYQDISLSTSIIKFIFISLACLTLPHMIFNMIPARK